MQASQVRQLRRSLTGPAKRVVSFTQERSFSSQQEGRTEFNEDIGESRYRQSVWKTQKGKRVWVSSLLGGLEFVFRTVVWWRTCPLRLLVTGRRNTTALVSSISHLGSGARDLGSRCLESVVLENIHEDLTWPLLRCFSCAGRLQRNNSLTLTRGTYTKHM